MLAVGGCMVYFDMLFNCIFLMVIVENLLVKVEIVSWKLVVDFVFWGGLMFGYIEYIWLMVEVGVIGFKVFLLKLGMDEF